MASIGNWKGQPLEELTKEQLLDVLAAIGGELQAVYADRRKWQAAADPLKYLSNQAEG